MKFSTLWGCPSPELFRNLSPGMVHVWRVLLKNDARLQADRYYPYLTADERAKAETFWIPHVQNQFVVTRGILRKLLSHYAEMPPADLRIENSSQGKPVLANLPFLPLQFNISHTSGMAWLAITVKHAVGIDVERLDRIVSFQNIAARYFSPRESARLMSLSPDNRRQEFFTYWTCKEAYLKMRGIGLSGGLAQYEIIVNPCGSKAEVWSMDKGNRKEDCSLFRVNSGQMYIGAVAVDGPSMDVSCWDWNE